MKVINEILEEMKEELKKFHISVTVSKRRHFSRRLSEDHNKKMREFHEKLHGHLNMEVEVDMDNLSVMQTVPSTATCPNCGNDEVLVYQNRCDICCSLLGWGDDDEMEEESE